MKSNGFTLIELVIVMGLLSVLMVITIVAINPGKRFQESRNTKRSIEVSQMLTAIHECIVDKKSEKLCIGNFVPGETYEITIAMTNNGCKSVCDNATSDGHCLQLNSALVDYFDKLPKDPLINDTLHTGYSLTTYTNGMVVVGACKAEGTVIKASR